MSDLATKGAIEIRIGDVPLEKKLDAIGAVIAAVREAHRDNMSDRVWRALMEAQASLAEAMMHANEGKLIK